MRTTSGTTHRPARTRRPATRTGRSAALAAAAAVLLAACATPDTPGDQPAPGDGAETEPATSLTISLDETGDGQARTVTLTCDPVGGDHPDAEAACATLEEVGVEAFEPVPADAACTMIFGGPQRANVVGSVDGTAVDADFEYSDGCEIDRWDTLAPVLGAEGGLL